MNKKKIFYFLFIFVVLLFLFKSINNNNRFSRNYFYFSTINEITIFGESESKSESILNGCDKILNDIENKMSKTLNNSDVSKINSSAGKDFVKVSNDTFYVISKALNYSKISNGTFDITIGPLSDLWGIGTNQAKIPLQNDINDKLKLIDYTNIILDESNKSIKLNDTNMQIDLGAIAKGYAADKIKEFLESENIKNAIINLGGNISIIGTKNNKELFTVGIQDPTSPRGDTIGNISLSNKSVVTSGVYERYIESNEKIYHHLLDPYTGYPFENDLSSVTIVSSNSINCDALSTSAFGLGLKDGLKLIESLDNVDAIFITKSKQVYLTSNIKGDFNLTDNSFTIVKD